jgi:WD40-like Beta Propeller Repeat
MKSNHETPSRRVRLPAAVGALAAGLLATLLSAAAIGAGSLNGRWRPSVPVLDEANSVLGGCPIESRDGLAIYTASTREEGSDDLDIWANVRADLHSPFGEAHKLPEPVNGDANDFCPSPLEGPYLLFVSTRDGGCGKGDIYLSRQLPWGGYSDPINLGCAETGDGPNSKETEYSPGIVQTWRGTFLYYSTDIGGDQDIYVSRMRRDGSFGPGHPVLGLNTSDDDRMPTVSRDGLEIVFSSNRASWGGGNSAGAPGQDVYYAKRKTVWHPWSDPVNLSVTVPFATEAMDETRASFSGDLLRINYGAGGEIYVSERRRRDGGGDLCKALPLPFCN